MHDDEGIPARHRHEEAQLSALLTPAEAEGTIPIPPERSGPRRTPWETVVYSAPGALPIELFGPAPPLTRGGA